MARIPRFNGNRALSQVAAAPGPSAAAGAGFGALSALAKMGEDFVKPAAMEKAREDGMRSVYRDENGVLKVDSKSVYGGELSDAHNSAAYAKYLSQRSIDVRDTMTELAIQHEFNPAGFRQATDAYISLLREDEDVPPLLREDVIAQAEREASARFNGLMLSSVDRTQRDANNQTSAHRDALADDYINLMMEGNVEAANEKMAEIEALTEFRTNAPYIPETPAQSEAYLSGTRGAARAAQLTRRLEDLSGARSITDDERQEIQDLVNDPDLDPATRSRLYAATQGRLKGIDGRAAADALGGTDVASAVRNYGLDSGPRHQTQIEFQMGPARPHAPNNPVLNVIGTSVEEVLGPGARVVVTSGQEGDLPQHGSNRHRTGDAADIAIYDAEGNRITATDPRMAEIARSAARNGARGIGFGEEYMGGSHIHIDLVEPGHGQGHFWASGAQAIGGELVELMGTGRDMAANREALVAAEVDVTPASEFTAAVLGVDVASAIFNADPAARVADLVSEEVIAANPILSNMTAEQAQAWAAREAVVKASDIAARRAQIDTIEDDEVRRIALNSLNDLYNTRRREEEATALQYRDRLEATDDTLTETEIMSDHSLSDQAQRELVNALRSQRSEEIEAAETLAELSDEATSWDPYDSSQRNRVDKAYQAMLEGADPLSVEGQTAAAAVTVRSGFVPKTMFNALRGAANGNDPAALAAAMEFAGQVTLQHPNALGVHDGKTDVLSALDDYRFYSRFMGSEEAAQRIIDNNTPEARARRSNLSDEARDNAKNISPRDITRHFDDMGMEVQIPSYIEGTLMGDYERLFREAYVDTGDMETARNRALSTISRTYGPSGINDSQALMRHPPTAYYAPVNGSHDWLGEQLARDVNAMVYGDDAGSIPEGALGLTAAAIMSPFMGEDRIPANRIMLTSDDQTQRDIGAGRPPSYAVRYMDGDDVIQQVGGRYVFERPSDADVQTRATIGAEVDQAMKDRNLRMWRDFYQREGMTMNEYNRLLMSDMDKHTMTAPPEG